MSRSRASARAAGSRFERTVADYLAATVDDRIDRRVKRGVNDTGDIGGLRAVLGGRIVAECKNVARTDLAGWMKEAEVERGNDDALAAVVIAKRHGNGKPGQQWVHMTVDDFIVLLTGERPNTSPAPTEAETFMGE